jgi:hypothetical protein
MLRFQDDQGSRRTDQAPVQAVLSRTVPGSVQAHCGAARRRSSQDCRQADVKLSDRACDGKKIQLFSNDIMMYFGHKFTITITITITIIRNICVFMTYFGR